MQPTRLNVPSERASFLLDDATEPEFGLDGAPTIESWVSAAFLGGSDHELESDGRWFAGEMSGDCSVYWALAGISRLA